MSFEELEWSVCKGMDEDPGPMPKWLKVDQDFLHPRAWLESRERLFDSIPGVAARTIKMLPHFVDRNPVPKNFKEMLQKASESPPLSQEKNTQELPLPSGEEKKIQQLPPPSGEKKVVPVFQIPTEKNKTANVSAESEEVPEISLPVPVYGPHDRLPVEWGFGTSIKPWRMLGGGHRTGAGVLSSGG
jgi:hypothetical protein